MEVGEPSVQVRGGQVHLPSLLCVLALNTRAVL